MQSFTITKFENHSVVTNMLKRSKEKFKGIMCHNCCTPVEKWIDKELCWFIPSREVQSEELQSCVGRFCSALCAYETMVKDYPFRRPALMHLITQYYRRKIIKMEVPINSSRYVVCDFRPDGQGLSWEEYQSSLKQQLHSILQTP